MSLVLAAHQIVLRVPESSGTSTESTLVFIGGVLAAIGAVIAAFVTSRGASLRLERSLTSERERFEKQLTSERKRLDDQFQHERYLARRAEASATVEQITRLVTRTAAQFDGLKSSLLRDGTADPEQFEKFSKQVNEMREEIGIVAVRFGNKSKLVGKMSDLLGALRTAMPLLAGVVGDEKKIKEQEEEIQRAQKQLRTAVAKFLVEARKAIEEY